MPQTEITILRSLLSAGDDFVSGNQLAQALGISRVGVWARLEKLREQGFPIEAVRHRGYRLTGEPPQLHAGLLKAHLVEAAPEVDLLFFSEIDSTNSEAERQLANGREAPFVVVAAHQTRGRGRLGRVWHSPPAGHFYGSFAFRPQASHQRMASITIWLGVQICHFLQTLWQVPAQVKWPNDLLIDGRKVAGMLTEARIDADRTRDLVFGLGLNLRDTTTELPPELAAVATSVEAHLPDALPANRLAAALVKAVLAAYEAYFADDAMDSLAALWPRYDALAGQPIQCEYQGQPLKGTACGIDAEGSLIVEKADGGRVAIRSGEVSLGTARWLGQ